MRPERKSPFFVIKGAALAKQDVRGFDFVITGFTSTPAVRCAQIAAIGPGHPERVKSTHCGLSRAVQKSKILHVDFELGNREVLRDRTPLHINWPHATPDPSSLLGSSGA